MNPQSFHQKLPHVVALTRLNRPIGIFLLLWPMLWALWLVSNGQPRLDVLLIFLVGTVLTRSAGCAINDYADREFDAHVSRTTQRPLATGALTARDALLVTAALMLVAFALVLLTNRLTIQLSFVALFLAVLYPFTKRVTHWPQLFLGAAFAFAIPMVEAAQTGSVSMLGWTLFIAGVLWALAYDTFYAMADRDDDIKLGLKSTAILLGHHDRLFVGLVQLLVLGILLGVGVVTERGAIYYLGLLGALGFVVYQLYITRARQPEACFQAFLNNNYLGLTVFLGIALDFLLGTSAGS